MGIHYHKLSHAKIFILRQLVLHHIFSVRFFVDNFLSSIKKNNVSRLQMTVIHTYLLQGNFREFNFRRLALHKQQTFSFGEYHNIVAFGEIVVSNLLLNRNRYQRNLQYVYQIANVSLPDRLFGGAGYETATYGVKNFFLSLVNPCDEMIGVSQVLKICR